MSANPCTNCGTELADDDEFCTGCGCPTRSPTATGPGIPVDPVPASMQTNSLAIAAFVISLVACAPIGLILGYRAREQIRESGEQGGGFALAAIILGWLGLAVYLTLLFFIVVIGGWAANSS